MSFFLRGLVVVALVAVWTVPLKAQAVDLIKLGEIVQRCRRETGATNEDIQSIFLRKVPETRTRQCLLACAGQKLGLARDGTLDAEGTLADAGRLLQGREQKILEAVKNAITACAEYSDTGTRPAEKELAKKNTSAKSTYNGVNEKYLGSLPRNSMESVHPKTSSSYQINHRVRRLAAQTFNQPQSQDEENIPNNPNQLVENEGITPIQRQGTNPNQKKTYPSHQYLNQAYPLQTHPNVPVDQTLRDISIPESVNPNPYHQTVPYPYIQPAVIPVMVAPIRGKRSPQEVVLTSTEVSIPPEVAAQISKRLRELLLALISAQDGLISNSTEMAEKDAEVLEDNATRSPRKRRDQPSQSKTELPFGQMFDTVRDRAINNNPLRKLVQGFHNIMSNSSDAIMNTMSTTASSPPAQTR